MSADHYTYRVRWSQPDRAFVATIAEFPSLSWLADSPTDALQGAQSLVAGVLDDMRETADLEDARFFEDEFDPATARVYTPAGFADLVASAKMRETSQEMVDDAVVAARRSGLTWPQIAVALGVSAQAARQRYKPMVDAALAAAGERHAQPSVNSSSSQGMAGPPSAIAASKAAMS